MLEEIVGEITGIVFRAEDTGYSVMRVAVKGAQGPTTVCGATLARVGEFITARGRWKRHAQHGMQLDAVTIVATRPTTPEAIARYLGSGVVKGVGESTAIRIVGRFGADTLTVLDEAPERLAEVGGIGPKTIAKIKEGWAEQKAASEIMVFLAGHDIGGAVALRIVRQYGKDSIGVIQANPYRLATEVRGIGFTTADGIARQLGIPTTSPQRIDAGIRHALREATAFGHCGMPVDAFVETTSKLLSLHGDTIWPVLDGMLDARDGIVPVRLPDVAECVFEPRLFEAEKRIARELLHMVGKAAPWVVSKSLAIETAEKAEALCGVTLAPEQRSAVIMALMARVSVLTGGPGTGKTSTLKVILEALRMVRAKVVMGAPTGKAAKRMRETTGHDAATVARLIGMGTADDGEREIDGDILVLDEASMVDVNMLDRVLRCLGKGVAILFVGDVDQLPSVGPGRVLADLIESEAIPVTRLTQVFRQAATSAIIRNAHRINAGQGVEPPGQGPTDFHFIAAETPEEITKRIVSLVREHIPERIGIPANEVQVLTPMRRTPTGAENLNVLLQEALNPTPASKVLRAGKRFGVGDRVLQTVNNYDLEVMNGESGVVTGVDTANEILLVDVDGEIKEYPFGDLDQLDLAYAMSIHKSQGSQFPAIVIPVTTQHYRMLQRSIIYTGITRAARFCVLVGQKKALDMAIRNINTEPRITSLKARLRATPKA